MAIPSIFSSFFVSPSKNISLCLLFLVKGVYNFANFVAEKLINKSLYLVESAAIDLYLVTFMI